MFSDRGQLAASEGRGGTAVFHMSRPPCNVIDILWYYISLIGRYGEFLFNFVITRCKVLTLLPNIWLIAALSFNVYSWDNRVLFDWTQKQEAIQPYCSFGKLGQNDPKTDQ